MLGHAAGIGYTGPGPRMGPMDSFSLVTGPTGLLTNQREERSRICPCGWIDFLV